MRSAAWSTWFALFSVFAYLQFSLGDGGRHKEVEAASASEERQKRAADELWRELTEGDGRAEDHEHWERIVRRSVQWRDPYYEDDTSHIVDIQEYYRYVLEDEEWLPEPDQDFARILHAWSDPATIQLEDDYMHMQKPIRGRYIVMLDSSAEQETLDRTIAVLQRAHTETGGMIRADHITPLRNIGVGFTATLNSRAVALVS